MSEAAPDGANPYASPGGSDSEVPARGPQAGCCPKCGWAESTAPRFTWWGGFLGPRLLKHVNCRRCGAGYNSKTGKSNLRGIIIYQVVVNTIILALCGLLIWAMWPNMRLAFRLFWP